MKKYVIGIEVGASRLQYGLFDDQMRMTHMIQRAADTEMNTADMMEYMEGHIRELIRVAGISLDDVRGIGAAFPSYIDFEHGAIIETPNIPAFNNAPVRDLMEKRLGVPIWLDNDANVAALAEHRLGAGRGHRDMIYVTVSSGVGGGLILNGELYRGIHGAAGEIGHMFVSDSTGYFCGCGVTGCVQSIASGNSMAEYAINRIQEGEESRILDYSGTLSRIDMLAVSRAFASGDRLAAEVLDRGAEYLGRMFHSLYQIFDINIFVYGGGVMKIGPQFVDRIVAAYKRYSSQMELRYPAQFLAAELGDNTGMIGAALLVP